MHRGADPSARSAIPRMAAVARPFQRATSRGPV